MNRQQKEVLIESLRDSFSNSEASYLVNYRGLTVEQMQQLRSGLRESNAKLKVAKARLMKRAVEGVEGADQLVPYFKEQIGAVFVANEAPAAAKVLYDFAKNNDALQLIVGVFESQLYDAQALERIASLPPREVLLAKLCGTLQAPITQTVSLLHNLLARLVIVLKQIEQKKQ